MPKEKTKLTFLNLCQKCEKKKPTTRSRSIYTKNYMGPCGDSFCYAGCDMEQCKPVSMTICDECCEELELKPAQSPPTR